jgi:hypothetical protein
MKSLWTASAIPSPGIKLRLALMCVIVALFSSAAFGQRTGTCIINDQVVQNCDLTLMNSTCTKNGQILPCHKPNENICQGSGLLIIRLNNATGYYERSNTYNDMQNNLRCRGLNMGFFGAASEVTRAFNIDESYWTFTGSYTPMTLKFFGDLSALLVPINSSAFDELTKSRQLVGLEGRIITNPEEIDTHLVTGEQLIAEKALDAMGIHRAGIVADINTRTKMVLDSRPQAMLNATMRAVAQVRMNKRSRTNRFAEYDYGDIFDRIAVGKILAAQNRK